MRLPRVVGKWKFALAAIAAALMVAFVAVPFASAATAVVNGDGDETANVYDVTGLTEGTSSGNQTVADVYVFSGDGACEYGSGTIDWGDSSGTSAATLTPDGVDLSHVTVSGSHTYADEGTYPISVTLDETGGCSDDFSSVAISGGNAIVGDGALSSSATTPSATEGQYFAASLGTLKDANTAADPSDYSVAETCYNDLPNPPSDCTDASLTPVVNHPGWFTVGGSHTFSEEGVYDVQTFITDGENLPGPAQEWSIDSYVTVSDAALTAHASNPKSLNFKVNKTMTKTLAVFTDADPNGTTSDFTADINWGDGNSCISCGVIVPNGLGGWNVNASHRYTSTGGKTITVVIHDAGTQSNAVAAAKVS